MADLAGGVYYFPPDAAGVTAPLAGHPCVVVLTISGTREAVVVPCFTAGRDTIAGLIAAYEAEGIDRAALTVTLDNRDAVAWCVNVDPAPEVEWATFQFDKIPVRCFDSARRWGELKPEPLRAVVTAVLAFAQTPRGKGQLSDHLLKRLRKLLG